MRERNRLKLGTENAPGNHPRESNPSTWQTPRTPTHRNDPVPAKGCALETPHDIDCRSSLKNQAANTKARKTTLEPGIRRAEAQAGEGRKLLPRVRSSGWGRRSRITCCNESRTRSVAALSINPSNPSIWRQPSLTPIDNSNLWPRKNPVKYPKNIFFATAPFPDQPNQKSVFQRRCWSLQRCRGATSGTTRKPAGRANRLCGPPEAGRRCGESSVFPFAQPPRVPPDWS